MPLNERNQRHYYRGLYAGQLETVWILKRGDDELSRIVTQYKLFNCRWSIIHKSGQPIDGDMSADHFRTIHIPTVSLKKYGITHINALDAFKDKRGRIWMNESTNTITWKLWENHVCVECRRTDEVAPVPQ